MSDSVLVIGGGPAGIQAALDMADMGINVHLVEREPAIGGRMEQLDTIFPTGCLGGCRHCSTSVGSGEPTDCYHHPRITVHTSSEVEKVLGSAGDFVVKICRRAGYVDPEACTLCGECAAVCPVSVPDTFNEGLSQRKAIYRPHSQSAPGAYLVSKRGVAPCKAACPVDTSAQGYIALIAAGRYEEAFEVIKRVNPFPATVGRVCSRPCETECQRAKVDHPVAMCALKRFVADWVYAHSAPKKSATGERATPTGATVSAKERRVAIVGSGPAGLSAADFLARRGYRTTVFEALSVAGGMMRLTIPSYRLPRDVLQREIDDILGLGVELRLFHPISDLDMLFERGFDAVLLAIGAHKPQQLGVPGEDATGVMQGLAFLRSVSLGERVDVGDRVVVIGDDNTAVYAARSALRLGAGEVALLCESTRDQMGAIPREVDEAEREGITFLFGVRVLEFVTKDHRVSGVCFRSSQAGMESVIPADLVVSSVPNVPEVSFLKPGHGLDLGPQGTIQVDEETLATSRPGVFAAGDATRGSDILIQAIADGRRAAASIDRYLRGVPLLELEERSPASVANLTEQEAFTLFSQRNGSSVLRGTVTSTPHQERMRGFGEVDPGLTEDQARIEAARCLQCGVCAECGLCVEVCEPGCIDLEMRDEDIDLNVGAIVVATGFDPFDPSVIAPYGYGVHPDVITSLEFERLASPMGPTHGRLLRLSNGEPVKSLAFIQCVGSRDVRYSRYCSSICCSFATQESIVAYEHDPDIRSTIYYMDLRANGKGFEECLRRAREECGVRYVRSRVSEIIQDGDGRPLLRYEDTRTGAPAEEVADLVILVTGLVSRPGVAALSESLGIEMDEDRFIKTEAFLPVDTTREGILACGFCRGPADISESVIQGSAAAARAAEFLARG